MPKRIVHAIFSPEFHPVRKHLEVKGLMKHTFRLVRGAKFADLDLQTLKQKLGLR